MATNKTSKLVLSLNRVEEERVKQTECLQLSVDDILAMGAIEYVIKHMTEAMRRDAHACAMTNQDVSVTDDKLTDAYKTLWLDFFRVQTYIDDVALHIDYVQKIGCLIFPRDAAMQTRFEQHDCSKYTFDEVYGYVLRWTHGVEDCNEWDEALQHHYKHNDHHPEFFGRGHSMPEAALHESVVDMLSWRLIKSRAQYAGEPVGRWLFDVDDRFLERYEEDDRRTVKKLLGKWERMGLPVDSL